MGYINELEYVEEDGMPYVYANIYLTATIVKIDFNSGIIVEEYNMQNIVDR
jgi:glutamine cyclotransferase